MRIIAFDPGSTNAGVAVLDVENEKMILKYAEQLRLGKADDQLGQRYLEFWRQIFAIVEPWLKVEELYVGMEHAVIQGGASGRTTTFESRAPVHMWCYERLGITPMLAAISQAKVAIGLKGNAKKHMIPTAVKELFPDYSFPETAKNVQDMYDAVAIACAIAYQLQDN